MLIFLIFITFSYTGYFCDLFIVNLDCRLVDFYVILSIRSAEKKDRLIYCKRLFALLERNTTTKIRLLLKFFSVIFICLSKFL